MDLTVKIAELREDISKKMDEERAIKSRIAELKQLLEEKKRREESLQSYRDQEAALLRELGLL